mmetsp:Transcript_105041/g.266837  ORF Transcript_105041/g.266837 Transcript_105041/m.266837 type:complete len:202 (-) Transcript_105041:237-842(-)
MPGRQAAQAFCHECRIDILVDDRVQVRCKLLPSSTGPASKHDNMIQARETLTPMPQRIRQGVVRMAAALRAPQGVQHKHHRRIRVSADLLQSSRAHEVQALKQSQLVVIGRVPLGGAAADALAAADMHRWALGWQGRHHGVDFVRLVQERVAFLSAATEDADIRANQHIWVNHCCQVVLHRAVATTQVPGGRLRESGEIRT